jgi:hypothetical protein
LGESKRFFHTRFRSSFIESDLDFNDRATEEESQKPSTIEVIFLKTGTLQRTLPVVHAQRKNLLTRSTVERWRKQVKSVSEFQLALN